MARSSAPPVFLVDWNACIGAGSEGEVYLGRSASTGELCAIKVSVFLDPEAAAEQLEQELGRCRRVAGEGVVRVLAWNLAPPRPFLVFELAHAGTLGDEMREIREAGGTYHPVRALGRIREILSSIAGVHEGGLVHRDVKPHNLLRFANGVKVTDFGSGMTADPGSPAEPGEVVGTRCYAAPEQLDGRPVDSRSDLYAVGCILHEMLTGRPPPAASTGDVFASPGARYPNALILPPLERLLVRLLDPSPAQRPASARAAIDEVDAVLDVYARARAVWSSLELGASPY